MTSLTELAIGILADARQLDEYTNSRGLGYSTFEKDTLSNLPPALEASRKSLINNTQTLKQLTHGPTSLLLETLFTFNDLLALRFIYSHRIPSYVPLAGTITYTALSHSTGISATLLRRFMQAAMLNRVFSEPRVGEIQHTAISRLLATDPEAMDTVGFLLEELAPASTKVIEAHNKWPGSGEPNETGFNIENSTSDPFYLELAKTPERSRRFGAGMRFMTRGSLYSLSHLITGYDWAALDDPADPGTVVDIGGGHGGVSVALAKQFRNIRFVVEDLPGTVKEGEKLLEEGLRDRITFQPHDFFQSQPVHHAAIYFFRFILHNWSDPHASAILAALLPALTHGSKIVIYEFLLPEGPTTNWTDKQGRNLDMIQATGWNSLERTETDWAALFGRVDPRYVFLGARTPPGSSVALVEAEFREGQEQQLQQRLPN